MANANVGLSDARTPVKGFTIEAITRGTSRFQRRESNIQSVEVSHQRLQT